MCRLLLCGKVDNILWIYTYGLSTSVQMWCDGGNIYIPIHRRNETTTLSTPAESAWCTRALVCLGSVAWLYWQSCDGKISFPKIRTASLRHHRNTLLLTDSSRSSTIFFFHSLEQLIGCKKDDDKEFVSPSRSTCLSTATTNRWENVVNIDCVIRIELVRKFGRNSLNENENRTISNSFCWLFIHFPFKVMCVRVADCDARRWIDKHIDVEKCGIDWSFVCHSFGFIELREGTKLA